MKRLDRLQYLGLFVADHIGVERNRRFHRGQAYQLEQMIRKHVAQRARGFVVTAAFFHTYGFRRGDLDVIDVIAVPDRLENAIGKAEGQNVLNRFFSQIMIDAIDLVLLKNLLDVSRFSARAESKSRPKGFSMITRRHWPFSSFAKPAAPS